MSNPIILVGGGAHCKVIIDIIKENKEYDEILISDIKENKGKELLGIRIEYTDDDLSDLYNKGIKNAFVSLGAVPKSNKRENLFLRLKKIGFKIPSIISKKIIYGANLHVGQGTLIEKGVIIDPDVKIGDNCIINKGCVISHDVLIENNVNLSPGVYLNGNVNIGKNVYIGTGAKIIQGISISDNIIIGAGSVVVKNISDPGTYVGIPAKKIKDL